MTTEIKPLKLTKRQKQMLTMLDQGMDNKTIAEKVAISEQTVKVHMWRLFKRLEVKSRIQAVKWWRDQQPAAKLSDMLLLQAAFKAACKFIDGKIIRQEFDFYRDQVAEIERGQACLP